MFKKSFILLLFFTVNIVCMDNALLADKPAEVQNIGAENWLSLISLGLVSILQDEQIQTSGVDKDCLLFQMPLEVLLEIIKYSLENCCDEIELKRTFIYLPQLNKVTYELLKGKAYWFKGFVVLENIKEMFYSNNNLVYKPITFKCNDTDSVQLIKKKLQKKINEFTKNKKDNASASSVKFFIFKLSKQDKDNLLLHAAKTGNLDLAQLALCNGADINAKGDEGAALIVAIYYGFTEIAQLLIKSGAKLEEKHKGWAPLIWAVHNSRKEIVQILIEHKADLKTFDDRGFTALTHTALKCDKEITQILLNGGADIEAKNQDGTTALIKSVCTGDRDMVTLLIGNGANLSATNNDGKTALEIAKASELTEIANLLDEVMKIQNAQNF